MRKIINSTYITLDGVSEGPHLWPSLISDHINAMPKYAAPAVGFDLTDTTTLSNGIVILSYRTDKTLSRGA
jgi:hypothetical protein